MPDEDRFAFGENWSRFLRLVDDRRIAEAEASLKRLLRLETLEGLTFLDAGSGSGLFSLAAQPRRPRSVVRLRRRLGRLHERNAARLFRDGDSKWIVERGSLLDEAYLESLGEFDVVYCWGVAHHTGDMRRALGNLSQRVAPSSGWRSACTTKRAARPAAWKVIKSAYQRLPAFLRPSTHAASGSGRRFTAPCKRSRELVPRLYVAIR